MKRFLAFICALVLAFTSFPVTEVFATGANADSAEEILAERAENGLFVDEMEEVDLFPDLCPDDSVPKTYKSSQENLFSDAFMDYLLVHFVNCEAEFKVEQFNIPHSQWKNLKDIIWYETPELFHVKTLSCVYTGDDIIQRIRVGYRTHADTVDEYQTCLKKMRDGAEYLLQGVKGNKNLTDVEKALILHDRLAIWTEYDLGNVNSAGVDHKIFAAYSALGEGLSVCQGYAMAYMYLLEQVGIESDMCSSDQLWHAWNIVYIDGVAYHVDVTWDDPNNGSSATYYDDYGRVLHNNFLLSTDGIRKTGHTASDYNTAPKDTRYDSNSAATWWRNSNTAIQLIGDKLYYQQLNGAVYNADNGALVHDHRYNSSCALSSANGQLLCAIEQEVHAVDIKNNETSVVYTASGLGNILRPLIQGMKYEKGKLHIQLTNYYGNVWRESIDYLAPECTEYTYTVENGEATITGYTGAGGDIVLPSELEGYPVTAIADYAFRKIETLTSVVIPDSVTAIGTSAFSNCTKLENVVISNNVSILNRATFSGCKELKSVTLGAGLLTIDSWAFSQCESLVTIELGGKIKKVGMYAFERCKKIETVTIGESLSEIGDYAFQNCENLTTLNFNAARCSFGTSTFEGGENKPVFVNCCALSNVIIGSGVKTIPRCFIYDCDAVKSIELPEGIVVIYDYAFSGCNGLTTVTIPKSLTSIGTDSFYNCTNIRTVYYGGTTEESKDLYYFSGNEALLNATWICTDPHQHNYVRKITSPTCTAKGYTTYTCTCGDTYKANYTNALGHSYKSGVCTRCKYKPAGAKITTQPVNVAVKSGKTATVSIKATGSGLKYTWYYAKKGAKTYTKASSTTNSYSLKMSSSYNGTKAYCVVTDQYGNSVKSNVVTLYKGTPAKITTQPKSTTVANGKTGKLTVKASGSSLKYSWYIQYKGASSFTKVGSSSKTYSFKMASKLDGAKVYCVVKDKYGIEVKSSVVTLKMPVQPKITTQPASVKLFSGKTAKLTVKASGDGLKYQWYYAKKGSSKFKKLSAKSATYSLKMSSSMDGRKVYCLVTDKYGQTVKSSVVTLTMLKTAKITTQPKNVSVKNGKAATVTIKATGDGLKYTWYYLLPGTTKYQKAAVTNNAFSVTMSAKYKNAKVYCSVADQYGNVVKSKTVTLKMK